MLKRAQRGDAAAFEQLVTPYERTLWRICWRYTRHQEDAADCLQETMLKAWRMLPQYRSEGELEAWLCRICSTCCLDFLRRRTRREADSMEALQESGFEPRDASPLPQEAAEASERAEALQRAIVDLPDDMREALVLTQIDGRSYEDTARITGVSVGTVKSRINRARQKLMSSMQEWMEHTMIHSLEHSKGKSVMKGERRSSK